MPHYFTETFTWAFDQQHWKPRPPSPDQSLATTRSTYSPGSLKVAVVDALPLNRAEGGAWKSAFSTAGLSLANITAPGPRNLLQASVTGGVLGAGPAPGVCASSATHTVSPSASGIVAESEMLCPPGPCTNGPVSANRSE